MREGRTRGWCFLLEEIEQVRACIVANLSFGRGDSGILNICAYMRYMCCEPIVRCPVDFLCRFPLVIFQQAPPVVLDTALLPWSFLPPSAKERSKCRTIHSPRDASVRSAYAMMSAKLRRRKIPHQTSSGTTNGER